MEKQTLKSIFAYIFDQAKFLYFGWMAGCLIDKQITNKSALQFPIKPNQSVKCSIVWNIFVWFFCWLNKIEYIAITAIIYYFITMWSSSTVHLRIYACECISDGYSGNWLFLHSFLFVCLKGSNVKFWKLSIYLSIYKQNEDNKTESERRRLIY